MKKQVLWGTVSSEEQGLTLQKVLGFSAEDDQQMCSEMEIRWRQTFHFHHQITA